MSLKLTDESLLEMLKPYVEEDESFVRPVFAVKRPSTGLFMLFGVWSSLATKYYSLGFTNKKVILVEVGMYSKQIKGGSVIYYTDIDNIKVKKIIGGAQITIKTKSKDKYIFRAGKPRNIKNQKDNLEEILKMFGNK